MPDSTPFIAIADGAATVRFGVSLYDETAVAKAAHSLTGECFVHLSRDRDEMVVQLRARQSLTNLEACAGRLANEALDYHLRGLLQKQTEPIRRLVIVQAFSKTNLFAPELDRAGLDEDPLNLKGQDRG